MFYIKALRNIFWQFETEMHEVDLYKTCCAPLGTFPALYGNPTALDSYGRLSYYTCSSADVGRRFIYSDYYDLSISYEEIHPHSSPTAWKRPLFGIKFEHKNTLGEVDAKYIYGCRISVNDNDTVSVFFGVYKDEALTTPWIEESGEQFTLYPPSGVTNVRANKFNIGMRLFDAPEANIDPDAPDWMRKGVAFFLEICNNYILDPETFIVEGVRSGGNIFLRNIQYSGSYYTTFPRFRFMDLYTNYNARPVGFGYDLDPEYGQPSEPEDYDPSFDSASDTITIPDAPTASLSGVGLENVYKISSNGLRGIGAELFPPLTYTNPAPISTQSDVVNALVDGFNSMIAGMANIPDMFKQFTASTLINYIVDCHVVPVSPTVGSNVAIQVGPKTLSCTGDVVTNDYKLVDCGSISLEGFYGNFADFLSNCKLYLPFVGFVPARPEWFHNTNLTVKYRFNVIDGSFMAYILSTGRYVNANQAGGTLVGQYSGVACMHIPITGVTYSSMVSGLVGAGSGIVAGAATGNLIGAAGSAINAASARGDIAQSNAYSSSSALLGCRRPYLLIERPVSNFSSNYPHERGLPSNVTRRLGNYSGFVSMEDVHLDGIDLTEGEKEELRSLLAGGVIN